MRAGKSSVSRRAVLAGSVAAGSALIAIAYGSPFLEWSGLSERMRGLKALLLPEIRLHRAIRGALHQAQPELVMAMRNMKRGGGAWYFRQRIVRAERERRFYAMSALERVFVTRAETLADCDFQHAAIEFYEGEFNDWPQVARRHFWARIAERRAQLAREA